MKTEKTMKRGGKIVVKLNNSQERYFEVHVGDAMLNGDDESFWLTSEDNGSREYLRKLPNKPMTVGVALFHSITELQTTLASGNYYIA